MARKDYDKKTVTCYLPKHLESRVQQYCTENNLTRKAKGDDETIEPRWGTGIVAILEEYFSGRVHGQVQDEVNSTVQDTAQSQVQDKVDGTVQDNTVQTQVQDKIESTVQKLESRVQKLEDDLQTTQHILEERLEQDKQQFKGYLLGLSCQWEEEKMEEKMEGISCNLPQPKEDDTWEPLMSLNEVEAKYGKKSTGDIPPENESGAKNPYDSPERRIKELIKKDRSHWDTVATLTQQQQAREIEDFLIRNGFKPEGFSFSSSALSRWKNTLYPKAPNPESKTYLAYRTYMAAIYNRGRK